MTFEHEGEFISFLNSYFDSDSRDNLGLAKDKLIAN